MKHLRKTSETMLELAAGQRDQDVELVRQAREGDRAAFDVLFQRHKAFVYNVCYRILGSADDAVDATQSAFIQAYRALKGFRGDSSFRSWVYRIAANLCTSMLRQELRRQEIQLDADQPATGRAGDDRVWETILELLPDLRAALVLFYFQGLSCHEMAEVMGCSEGAVRTRLHRARIAFKKKYEEIKR